MKKVYYLPINYLKILYISVIMNTSKEDVQKKSLNMEVYNLIKITSQELILIKFLEEFYSKDNNIDLILPIIRGNSNISMRLIDYFVTNYSKKYRISYNIKENNTTTIFNVYSSYKSQLKAYNKKYFDPFSRGDRIPFFFKNDCQITTIGQLNFFKWFISKNILQYIIKNLSKIELDLNSNKNSISKKSKKKKTPRLIKKNTRYNNTTYPTQLCFGEKKPMDIVVTFE